MECGLRTCSLSLEVADALGLDASARSCVYDVALLRLLGCTSDASETAVLAGGDDVAFNATMAPMLGAQPGERTHFFVRHLAEDLPLHRRRSRVVAAMADPGMERGASRGTARWPPVWVTASAWPRMRVATPLPGRPAAVDGEDLAVPAGWAGQEQEGAVGVLDGRGPAQRCPLADPRRDALVGESWFRHFGGHPARGHAFTRTPRLLHCTAR